MKKIIIRITIIILITGLISGCGKKDNNAQTTNNFNSDIDYIQLIGDYLECNYDDIDIIDIKDTRFYLYEGILVDDCINIKVINLNTNNNYIFVFRDNKMLYVDYSNENYYIVFSEDGLNQEIYNY